MIYKFDILPDMYDDKKARQRAMHIFSHLPIVPVAKKMQMVSCGMVDNPAYDKDDLKAALVVYASRARSELTKRTVRYMLRKIEETK